MSSGTALSLDCRGLRCPSPIVHCAKAARKLASTGGAIEILADDDDFPVALRSWCRSSGAELEALRRTAHGHRATIRVRSKRRVGSARRTLLSHVSHPRLVVEDVSAAPPSAEPPSSERVLDCRGMLCPAPLLELARAARESVGQPLAVLADDEGFELAIKSWCRATGAELLSLDRDGEGYRARVVPVSATPTSEGQSAEGQSAPASEAPRVRVRSKVRVLRPIIGGAASSRPGAGSPSRPGADSAEQLVDISGYQNGSRLAALEHAAAEVADGTTLRVMAGDATFTSVLMNWCSEQGHQLRSLNGVAPVVARVRICHQKAAPPLHVAVEPEAAAQRRHCALLLLHNDPQALAAALEMANEAAHQGMQALLFFTGEGVALLRAPEPPEPCVASSTAPPEGPRNGWLGRLFRRGQSQAQSAPTSGPSSEPSALLAAAAEQGVRLIACNRSIDKLGLAERELLAMVEFAGPAAFVKSSLGAALSLTF